MGITLTCSLQLFDHSKLLYKISEKKHRYSTFHKLRVEELRKHYTTYLSTSLTRIQIMENIPQTLVGRALATTNSHVRPNHL